MLLTITSTKPLATDIGYLNEQRLGAVLATIKSSGAKRILDLGCGEGKLLKELLCLRKP